MCLNREAEAGGAGGGVVVSRFFRIKRVLPVKFTLAFDSMKTTHLKTLNNHLWLKHDKCSAQSLHVIVTTPAKKVVQVVFAKITRDDSS